MNLFGKKKEFRFESITIDRQREVFRGLEDRGWILCQDTFQFDMEKPPDKIRKMAMKQGKDLKCELLIEIWDPIYQAKPWKGLSYGAFRKMTSDEIIRRQVERKKRPNYDHAMGDVSDMLPSRPQIQVNPEDLKALESIVEKEHIHADGMGVVSRGVDKDMGPTDSIKAVAVLDPLDHQGEMGADLVKEPAKKEDSGPRYESAPNFTQGAPISQPLFDSSMKIETLDEVLDKTDLIKEVDPLAMMIDAADREEAVKTPAAPAPAVQPTQAPPVQAPPQAPAPQVPAQTAPSPNMPPAATPAQTPAQVREEDEGSGQ